MEKDNQRNSCSSENLHSLVGHKVEHSYGRPVPESGAVCCVSSQMHESRLKVRYTFEELENHKINIPILVPCKA